MPSPNHLPQAIERLCAISARDMAHLRSVTDTPTNYVDTAIFCDAVIRHGGVDAYRAHLREPTAHTHGQLSSLLNLLLRRSAKPVRDGSRTPVPSDDFGRAVIFALVALSRPDDPG